MDTIFGFKVVTNKYMLDEEEYEVKQVRTRSIKERLFSRPWRPWVTVERSTP